MTGNDSRREADEIARKARLKQEAQDRPQRSAWYGLGLFGLVGWAVAVPTIAGVALGLWIDARTTSGPSWTLVLLLAGAALGCLNAWYWIQREGRDE
ncbi:AtpZ/AtpI family protein [Defluviimonas sp. D31]|uniref:AtpZ/AtpI family protein n=1 Tax=Defluviimonas sp. D31 TaxID=3083253 RepID=UPI00296F124E|nr:AtpZ/AtpI family protein [Defluviimonas sp. D31]MDW4547916.1 AtpZ/AtpI family protein [Defluviimonas sp. D31]